MKKNSKELLFERMHTVGGMPLNENNLNDDLKKLFSVYKSLDGNYMYPTDHNIFLYKKELEDKLKNSNASVLLTYPNGSVGDVFENPIDAWNALRNPNNNFGNPEIV